MPKTKPQPGQTLPDDANSLSVLFYISDAASGNLPRVSLIFPPTPLAPNGAHFDHAVSEYTTLTAGQKTTLRALLLAIRDETFTLEGYA